MPRSDIECISAKYKTSGARADQLPPVEGGVEVACVGRSNSGKSSLINAVAGQRQLAFASSEPGRTALVSQFALTFSRAVAETVVSHSEGEPAAVEATAPPVIRERRDARKGNVPRESISERERRDLVLLDLPGYGYAKRSHSERGAWQRLAHEVIFSRNPPPQVLLIFDIRRGIEEEESWILQECGPAQIALVVLSKADKLTFSERKKVTAELKKEIGGDIPVVCSATHGKEKGLGLQEIRSILWGFSSPIERR